MQQPLVIAQAEGGRYPLVRVGEDRGDPVVRFIDTEAGLKYPPQPLQQHLKHSSYDWQRCAPEPLNLRVPFEDLRSVGGEGDRP